MKKWTLHYEDGFTWPAGPTDLQCLLTNLYDEGCPSRVEFTGADWQPFFVDLPPDAERSTHNQLLTDAWARAV